MKKRVFLVLLLLVVMMTVVLNLSAQQQTAAEQANYALKGDVLGSGGGTVAGGGYKLQGTIGQANADVAQGGNYYFVSGFWHPRGTGNTPDDGPMIFLPSVIRD